MPKKDIGNVLNNIVRSTSGLLVTQVELAQLTYNAFNVVVNMIENGKDEKIRLDIPVGYRSNKTPILYPREYKKQELIDRYCHLGFFVLPINGIFQVAAIMEAMFSDITREVVLKFPHKISLDKKISFKEILQSDSIEKIHLATVDILLNELSYKSPLDYAKRVENILSINLLECTAYHKYIEMKATRDIVLHNKGIVNEVYLSKSDTHAREELGNQIPVTQDYFMEMYDACLQITQWLEKKLHEKWHSSEYETRLSEATDESKNHEQH